MNRYLSWITLTIVAVLVFGRRQVALADPVVLLKVGTLTSPSSPWGQVFRTWDKKMREKTKNAIGLQLFWAQGDELAMAAKLRSGQLDGAAVSVTGLSQFDRDIWALQLPGFYEDWNKFDEARARIKNELEAELSQQKMIVFGWVDEGLVRLVSKGGPIKNPEDLKHRKMMAVSADVIGPALLHRLNLPIHTIRVSDILPALDSGQIDVVQTSSLMAEQLQWVSRLEYINTLVLGAGVGALIFSKDKVNSLPSDVRQTLMETGMAASQTLSARLRKEDDASFQRLKRKLATYEPTQEDRAAWAKFFQNIRKDLCGPVLKSDICRAVSP